MKYKFAASERYWKNFYALDPYQKELVREAWEVFKLNPFDPCLGTHKIERLSALAKGTVYSVVIHKDLRVLFLIRENTVYTIDVGTHDLYE